jgi:hypothetical protein
VEGSQKAPPGSMVKPIPYAAPAAGLEMQAKPN